MPDTVSVAPWGGVPRTGGAIRSEGSAPRQVLR